jgi:hypothetical protein
LAGVRAQALDMVTQRGYSRRSIADIAADLVANPSSLGDSAHGADMVNLRTDNKPADQLPRVVVLVRWYIG